MWMFTETFDANKFIIAAQTGNKSEVERQLSLYGADVDVVISECSALRQAILNNQEEVVNMLINAGANVNMLNMIIHAAYSGNVNIVSALVKAGADTTTKSQMGRTPLEIVHEQHPQNDELIKILDPGVGIKPSKKARP